MSILKRIKRHHYVTVAAWVSRGIQAVLQFFMLSMITEILNVDEYAVFILVSSLLVWFLLSDLGVGFALQNKISQLKVMGEDYEVFIANIFVLGFIVVAILCMASWIVTDIMVPFYLNSYVGEKDYQTEFLICSFLMICIGVFSIIYKVWYALGVGYWSSIMPALGTIVSCVLLYVALHTGVESILIIFMIYFVPLAFLPFLFYVLKLISLKEKINFSLFEFQPILSSAKKFLFFGVMSALILNVDFFLASQFLPSEQIVQYHTLFKFFYFGLFVYSAFLMAIWPIFSESIQKNQSEFVFKSLRIILPLGMLFMVFYTLLLGLYGDVVFSLIIKNTDSNVEPYLVLMFGCYFVIRIWTDTFAVVLQSGNEMNSLIRIVPVQAVTSVALQIILIYYFQIYGLISALIISYLLTVSWYLPYVSYKFLASNSGRAS